MRHEAYEKLEGVNWSTLKLLGKSPAHYLYRLQHRDTDDTDAKQRGRVTHMAVFEPERFAREVAVYSERRAGKEWQAFLMAHEGKEVVTSRMFDAAVAIATAARGDSLAARYLAGGKPELVARWEYQSPAIAHLESWTMRCKGRLDFVADCGAIVDLKTTRDASPAGFAREVLRYEHHAQAAFYVDGYAAMTGEVLPFVIVAVEATAPHVVQVYRVPDEVLELGRERYSQLLAQLRVCREESRWPGYADTEMELQLPAWAMPSGEDELDEELVIDS